MEKCHSMTTIKVHILKKGSEVLLRDHYPCDSEGQEAWCAAVHGVAKNWIQLGE